ncbi:ABC transporter substrate-binding protein [Microbacterium ulmi]|uniref:ABC transporter substrate-binding protein n=1 Tax=Microbacterium ulmi TaxID=179095 RepID=A0A7Y2M1C9_9MICO|nr:ABC transporter substrate-binding protein [Microbacterium ulmi]NII69096.1 peptide/nickel transport system substrate-binding protein [Microbacterium ulmi]NNH04710.1 ABC transporter substrate-binding protein [Microbacterium ulmi]
MVLKRARLLAALAGVVATGLVAVACSAPADEPDDQETLIWAASSALGTLDIAASLEVTSRQLLFGSVLEGLTELKADSDGNYDWEPLLATSWEQIEPTKWRFELRTDVTFSDGQKLTARDVAFSVNKIADPASSRASILNNLASAEVVDDDTVDIITKTPDFFAFRAAAEIAVQPDGWGTGDTAAGAATTAIGTGPYVLKDLSAAKDQATLEVRDGYWRDITPYFSTVQMRVIPDTGARFAALQAGEIQVALDLSPDLLTQAPATLSAPATEVEFVRIDTLTPPLDDVRVRQALNYAVDKDVLINDVRQGFAEPAHGQGTFKESHGFNPDVEDYPYDPEEAKRLLEEAGAADLTLDLVCGDQYGVTGTDTCQTLVTMWNDVGIDVNFTIAPYESMINDFLLARKNGLPAPNLLHLLAGSDTLTATPYIQNYLNCGPERGQWCDPVFMEEADKALAMTDADEQAAAYRDLMQYARDEAPLVFLTNPRIVIAVAEGIQGVVYGNPGKINWAEYSRSS